MSKNTQPDVHEQADKMLDAYLRGRKPYEHAPLERLLKSFYAAFGWWLVKIYTAMFTFVFVESLINSTPLIGGGTIALFVGATVHMGMTTLGAFYARRSELYNHDSIVDSMVSSHQSSGTYGHDATMWDIICHLAKDGSIKEFVN